MEYLDKLVRYQYQSPKFVQSVNLFGEGTRFDARELTAGEIQLRQICQPGPFGSDLEAIRVRPCP